MSTQPSSDLYSRNFWFKSWGQVGSAMGKGASIAAEEAAAPLTQAWAGLDLVSSIQKSSTGSFIQVISVSLVHLHYEAMWILLWGTGRHYTCVLAPYKGGALKGQSLPAWGPQCWCFKLPLHPLPALHGDEISMSVLGS